MNFNVGNKFLSIRMFFFTVSFLLLFFIISIFKNNILAETVDVTVVSTNDELVNAISVGGYIKLNNDIEISSTLYISNTTVNDLNGYMLRQTSKVVVFNGVNLNGKSLTINDSRPNENSHYFLRKSDAAWEYVDSPVEGVEYEIITGGIITGGYNKTDVSSSGGGAFKLNTASDYVIINGGTIVGNYAERAGGASYSGAVTMNGGRICGNAAGKFAGAIALSGDFIMHGGIIEDNYSPSDEKIYNFYVTGISIGQSSNFTITGGVIKDNIGTVKTGSKTTLTVSGDGLIIGNIYLQNGIKANIEGGKIQGRIRMLKGSCTMSGGEITNGVADDTIMNYFGSNGGGISVEGGNFTMTGGIVYNNTSSLNGGGVYVNGGTFEMLGGKIYDNTAINGGGVFVNSGSVTITNGSIENNLSSLNGGGISIGGTGTFTLDGGVISNNQTTSGDGGGIYLESGTVAMTNGSIENNKSSLNGGGVAIGGSGTFTMSGGEIKQNVTLTGNGGGIYIANGNIQINDGIIKENKSVNSTGGLGGGICVSSGSILMNDGTIENNEAKNGGGFYLTQGTFEIKNGSLISKNKAENGAGGYVVSGEFNLTGGTTSNNIATSNGGGYYIVDTETVDLSNGIISNNEAKNGGGFYQTQTSEHITSTTLSGTCYVNNNVARDGNGGGIYVDGGSVFRIVNGKVIYNKATGMSTEEDLKSNLYTGDQLTNTMMVYAKDSSGGVGGGVYIKNGTFTMKDEEGNDGTAAIFGNTAEYAADDLFAYGNGLTTFDAIPVITMEKDDAYLNSTDWFEDYPKGERHISLRISDSLSEVTSNDRYKSITSENLLVKADSVLTTSTDYICITMGANVGGIMLNIDDSKVGSDGMFIYTLSDELEEVKIKISVKQGKTTKITNLPIGSYVLKLNSEWSWKYTENFDAEIKKGSEIINFNDNEQINVNVVGGQTMVINTKYNIKYKKYFTKTLSIKIPLSYGNLTDTN